MKGGRGQGLPLNTIVLAIIALLILVLIIAFATGTLGRLFGGTQTIIETATPEEVAAFRIGCERACFTAKQLADTPTKFENSDYCGRKIKINGTDTYCWQLGVGIDCPYQITLPSGEQTCEGKGEGNARSCTCA